MKKISWLNKRNAVYFIKLRFSGLKLSFSGKWFGGNTFLKYLKLEFVKLSKTYFDIVLYVRKQLPKFQSDVSTYYIPLVHWRFGQR